MTASNSDTINQIFSSQFLTAGDFRVLLVQEYYVFTMKQPTPVSTAYEETYDPQPFC